MEITLGIFDSDKVDDGLFYTVSRYLYLVELRPQIRIPLRVSPCSSLLPKIESAFQETPRNVLFVVAPSGSQLTSHIERVCFDPVFFINMWSSIGSQDAVSIPILFNACKHSFVVSCNCFIDDAEGPALG